MSPFNIYTQCILLSGKLTQALVIQSFYWGLLIGMTKSFAIWLNSISSPSLPALSPHSNARLNGQANICGSKHSPLITWFIFPTWLDHILKLSRGPSVNHLICINWGELWGAQLHSRNQGHNPAKLCYNDMFLIFCLRFASYIYY